MSINVDSFPQAHTHTYTRRSGQAVSSVNNATLKQQQLSKKEAKLKKTSPNYAANQMIS